MNNKLKSGFALLAMMGLTLSYQNCARIGYADEKVAKDSIDGSLTSPPVQPPGLSKIVQFPDSMKNKMTIAFEDLMTTSNTSANTDLDYNDFVMTYNVREESAGGFLKKIEITVVPQARQAGYEAQLLLGLGGAIDEVSTESTAAAFLNSAEIEAQIEYFDQNDVLISSSAVDVSQPVVVFKKTSQVFISQSANLEAGTSANPIKVLCREQAKVKAKITITGFLNRDENRARPSIEVKRYPFYLYVEPTRTLMGTIDLNPSHKTKDNYPMGFQVPGTFLHPAERRNIHSVYPYFQFYLQMLNGVALDRATLEKAVNWANWLEPDWATKLACSPVREI